MSVDGGPAFPLFLPHNVSGAVGEGMSLRDWFAGQMAPVMFAEIHRQLRSTGTTLDETTNAETVAAVAAYAAADALIAVRSKP